MSDLTIDDAEQVISGGKTHLAVQDYQRAYDDLFPLHEANFLPSDRQGDLAAMLGDACWGLGSLDVAVHYFEQAVADASSDWREHAQNQIEEIRRLDGIVDDSADGVTGETEVLNMLGAGDEAMGRTDWDTAWSMYEQAYGASQVDAEQVAHAAIGMAECLEAWDRADEAHEYLDYAFDRSVGDIRERAEALKERLSIRANADDAMSDGSNIGELVEMSNAALAAAEGHDFESAFRYFEAIMELPNVPPAELGRAQFNAAICCLYTHDYDAAHQYFGEAVRLGDSEIGASATHLMGRLENSDTASDLAYEFSRMP